ncbi:MAG: hypothetical protein BWY27_01360 [Bacteroidetes bacterium ADurb.Bin234]|nr:MAG: hypothetical protein BWY27_01360 [Bacteroidetes bacterium ADurb.Bin234]
MAVKPVIALVKLPAPVPSEVLLSAIVGVSLVLQHTPRAVTVAPPSELITPPLVAVVLVTAVASLVLTTGIVGSSQLVKKTEDKANSIAGIQNLIFVFIFAKLNC